MTFVLLILLAGSGVFMLLAMVAAESYRSVRPAPLAADCKPAISVLKPLHGLDEGLEENLRSFFSQRYPKFEILFAVESEDDAATPVVHRLMEEYPEIPARLLIAGASPHPNAKVHSLRAMLKRANHETVAMVDSDVRVTPSFLDVVAAEMSEADVALVTCPYRAVAGASFWSWLEAIGLNTEFIAGVLVARMLGGMDFALGPAVVTRKAHLEEIGGLAELQEYLAEDFVMGKRLAQLGRKVVLSSYAIEHRIGSQTAGANLSHRLRWNRSTRRSRPFGYAGQLFTHALPLSLALAFWEPGWWPLAAFVAGLRYVAAWRTSRAIQADISYLWLPVQDCASIAVWAAGFFGREIVWRARRFTLDRLGRFEPVNPGLERTDRRGT